MSLCMRIAPAVMMLVLLSLSPLMAGAAPEPVSIDAVLSQTEPVPERIEWQQDGTALRLYLKGQAGAANSGLRIPLDGGRPVASPYAPRTDQSADGRTVRIRTEPMFPQLAKPPAPASAKAGAPQRVVFGEEPPGAKRVQTVVEQQRGGGTDRWVLPGDVRRWSLGPGNSLYAVMFPGRDADLPDRTELVRLDPGAPAVVLFRVEALMQEMQPVRSPDGTRMALAFDSHIGRWDDYVCLHVLDLAGGAPRRIDAGCPATSEYAWASDDRLLFVRRDSGWNHLAQVTLGGEVRQLTWGQHRVQGIALSPSRDRVAYLTEDATGRREVRVLELASGENRVVHVAADPAAKFQLGEIRRVEWKARDGLGLKGFLVLPPGFDSRQKHGLFVDVHGGGPGSRVPVNAPLTLAHARGPLAWHRLASLGWVVFVADYRSAGDYGADAAARRYATGDTSGIEQDADDVADGIAALLGEQWLDAKRVVGFGHSAGGPRVHSLLVRTGLFRAAILNESIGPGAVAPLLYLTTGPNAGQRFSARLQTMAGASFRDRPEAYYTGHLFDGWKIRAPVLMLSGGNHEDGAAPMLPNELLLSMLREMGVPARYVRYPGEGHNYSNSNVVRDALEEVEAWLRLHAGSG